MFLFLVLINVTWTLLFNLVLLVFFVPFPTILIIVMGEGGGGAFPAIITVTSVLSFLLLSLLLLASDL